MTECMYKFSVGRFTICATISPDADTDLSWDETGEVTRGLQEGTLTAFMTKVSVLCKGVEIGTAYLGGSIYRDPSDFFTEHKGLAAVSRRDGVNYGAYFPEMVREAIAEAREWLRGACQCPAK